MASRIADAILADFEAHHERFLKDMREDDPNGYLQLIIRLLPKTVEVSMPDLGELSEEQISERVSDLRSALDLIEQGTGTLLDVEAVLLGEAELPLA